MRCEGSPSPFKLASLMYLTTYAGATVDYSYYLIFNASDVVPYMIQLPRTLPWLLDFDAYSVVRP